MQPVPQSKLRWLILALVFFFVVIGAVAGLETVRDPTLSPVARAQNYRGIVICLVFAVGLYAFSRSRLLQRALERVEQSPVGVEQRVRDSYARVERLVRNGGVAEGRRSWALAWAMAGSMIGIIPAMMIAVVLAKPDDPELLPNVPAAARVAVLFVLAVAVSFVAAVAFRRRTTTLRGGEILRRPLIGAAQCIKLDEASARIELAFLQRATMAFKVGIIVHLTANAEPDLQLHADHVIGAKGKAVKTSMLEEDDITLWAVEHFGLTASLVESISAWIKQP